MSAGLYTNVHIDLGDVDKGLDAMARKSVIAAALKDLKGPMRLDQREHAKAKSGPEGSWAPRAASTVAARASARRSARAGGKRRAVSRALLGRLPSAVSYRATTTAVIAESRVGWSLAHMDGDVVGHGARLPARPFLWISDKLMATAEETIGSRLLSAYGGI